MMPIHAIYKCKCTSNYKLYSYALLLKPQQATKNAEISKYIKIRLLKKTKHRKIKLK